MARTEKPAGLINILRECRAAYGPNRPHGLCNCIEGRLAKLSIDALVYYVELLNDRSEELEAELVAHLASR